MKIHIISTINGLQNEGMRNVATHLGKAWEQSSEIIYSSFRDVVKMPVRCLQSDVTVIFAKCNSKIYYVARLCRMFCKKVFLVVVQRPDMAYITKNNKHPLKCHYFTICRSDTELIKLSENSQIYDFSAGINTEKFFPVNAAQRIALKHKYGVSTDRPLVIHVGHCSVGRGLEDFAKIDEKKFERLVVASGMFENSGVKDLLIQNGIQFLSGYIPEVNEIYQMADVYLFPTRLDDFVISVPLSILEALACGTPVVGYRSFQKLHYIQGVSQRSISMIEESDEIQQVLMDATMKKSDSSLLEDVKSWEAVGEEMLEKIRNCR